MAFTPGQVLTAAELNTLEAATIPTGGITMYGAGSAPTGWLLCDGTAVSRTTYASLFAVVGETYGVGNGTTTFNLPNLKGRVPVGRDSADTLFDVLGEVGGAKTHTLTTSEMPSHTHTQDAHTHTQNAHGHSGGSHTHGATVGTGYAVGAITIAGGAGTSKHGTHATGYSASPTSTEPNGGTNFPAANHSHGVSIEFAGVTVNNTTATNQNTTATNQNTGGGAAHNNLQPYLVLNFIIKT